MSQTGDPDDPQETVLHARGRRTGEEPKVHLRSSDPDGEVSPAVDRNSGGSEILPRGRRNYRLLGEIARGGMGTVLRGHDSDLGRDVAVKVLDERWLGNPAMLRRFVEEAQIGGQLQHPGVVPVYELGMMADERPYFTMKLIRGRTLAALLERRNGLDDDRRRFLSIYEAVCQTVAYAHSKGVIHRDLKPANVMVGAFGEVQVVDWGLAKVLATDADGSDRDEDLSVIGTARGERRSNPSDSIAGSALGTPAYMPPEQARGDLENVDERSDVFALGGILCEILTGAPPYQGREDVPTVLLAARAELGPARSRIESCAADRELKEIASDCLAPAQASRPRSAQEVAERVQGYLAALEERAHRAELAATEARELRRRQRLGIVLGVTVLTAVIAVGLALRSMERQRAALRLERVASIRGKLDDAAIHVAELQDAGRHDDALAEARAALAEVEAFEPGDEATTGRARRIVDLTAQRASEFQRRQELQRRNDALLARCEELRTKQIDTLVTFGAASSAPDLDAAYAQAFEDYGIEPSDEGRARALEVLAASGIGGEVALALDDWAGIRRQVHGPRASEVESVVHLALDLDLDPARTRLRKALLAGDGKAVLAFAQEEDLAGLAPSTLWGLSQGLDSFGQSEALFSVVRGGAVRYPGDFLLNIRAGQLYGIRGAYVTAMRFLSAALGVRPGSAAVHVLLAEYLRKYGDLPRAAQLYVEALNLNPDYTEARNSLAWLQVLLGDYAGAVRSYALLVERFPGRNEYDFRLLVARFLAEDASRSELIERLETDASLAGRPQSSAVWALCYHPDASQRDPARVIAIQDSWGHEEPATEETEAAALLQLGRPSEALAALDHGEDLLWTGAESVVASTSGMTRAEFAVLRARAYYDLGDEERALRHLQTARQIMRAFMSDGPEPWSGTPLVRMYRETAELLGR